MKSKIKKCPHCGSTSTLPIAYGLISDEGHKKNNESKEWVWGGCKYGQNETDHCNDCGENFGEVISYDNGQKKMSIKELQSYIIKMDARRAKKQIKEDIKNLFLKFKSFIGLSSAKHK
ncbi:hypothetical protein R5P06_03555 [Candidatus Thioglobus autotrophicus]|uniref:hypothetical protein n=1 Tax=Candidatus Thioglobus autotrophicus TaxID=1705394 RepID=UPI00299D1DA9|nr:hypothetical protein [Candidatus Thioglobus autotrophicus]WPE17149.1 hypothetical protein R5P06_03555 [Candidatus Thioglobus autotrophicus]